MPVVTIQTVDSTEGAKCIFNTVFVGLNKTFFQYSLCLSFMISCPVEETSQVSGLVPKA